MQHSMLQCSIDFRMVEAPYPVDPILVSPIEESEEETEEETEEGTQQEEDRSTNEKKEERKRAKKDSDDESTDGEYEDNLVKKITDDD